jgi:hypothetical protein
VLAFCIAQIAAAVALAICEPISRALMSDASPKPLRLQYQRNSVRHWHTHATAESRSTPILGQVHRKRKLGDICAAAGLAA